MIVLHDRHSAEHLLDRVVRLGQGLVIEDRPLDPAGAASTRSGASGASEASEASEASGAATGRSGSETRDVNEPSQVGFTRWTSA